MLANMTKPDHMAQKYPIAKLEKPQNGLSQDQLHLRNCFLLPENGNYATEITKGALLDEKSRKNIEMKGLKNLRRGKHKILVTKTKVFLVYC